jgi:hypothetical protein
LLATTGSIKIEISADPDQYMTKKKVASIQTAANAELLAEARASGGSLSIGDITPVEVCTVVLFVVSECVVCVVYV